MSQIQTRSHRCASHLVACHPGPLSSLRCPGAVIYIQLQKIAACLQHQWLAVKL